MMRESARFALSRLNLDVLRRKKAMLAAAARHEAAVEALKALPPCTGDTSARLRLLDEALMVRSLATLEACRCEHPREVVELIADLQRRLADGNDTR